MSERALASGADGYVQKGLSLKLILDYVRAVFDDTAESTTPSPPLTLVPPPTPAL